MASVQVCAIEEPQAVVVPAAHVTSIPSSGDRVPPIGSVWEAGFALMMVTDVAVDIM